MAAASLDDDEKGVSNVYTPGGPQSVTIINESGLYRLIMTSTVLDRGDIGGPKMVVQTQTSGTA